MPSRIRDGLLISLVVIGLFVMWFSNSHAQTINYIYDELNRLIRVEYGSGMVIEYTYDKVGNRLKKELQITDTTAPTTTASPPGGPYNTSQTVTLTCKDEGGSGCNRIYYTTDGATPTTSSSVYSTPINIPKSTPLKFFATDLAGNTEIIKTEIYTIDTIPPTGTITINSGAALTNNPNVTLTLSCIDNIGCSQMQLSNDNVTYSTPETYATSKVWTLTSGDDTKTVYVKFKDTAGNWSSAYSNTILLDATPPTTGASPVGGNYNSPKSVILSCSDGSGSGFDKIYYTTDGTIPTTSSPVYSSPINVSVTTTLKFFAMDFAGHSEAVKSETYTIVNRPPVADAGSDRSISVGADCQGIVTLDGRGSTDPDNDSLRFTWSGPFGTTTGPTPNVILPKGTHRITLTVDDGKGGRSSDTVVVTVQDTTAPIPDVQPLPTVRGECSAKISSVPTATDNCVGKVIGKTTDPLTYTEQGTFTITWTFDDGNGNTTTQKQTVIVKDTTPPNIKNLTVSPNVLSPPNHKMVPVVVAISLSDNCDAAPACKIISVGSNEPENGLGDGDTAPDWEITGNLTVNLRAERSGTGSGRVYTIKVQCTDTSGNSLMRNVIVTVPHDQRKK